MSAAEVLAQQVYAHRRHPGRCSCGEHLRAPGDSSHAKHLADVQLDALKAAGYGVVELPNPDVKNNRPLWGVLVGGEPEDVYVRPSGEVVISGAAVLYDDEARRLGEVLLAAANAAEATS